MNLKSLSLATVLLLCSCMDFQIGTSSGSSWKEMEAEHQRSAEEAGISFDLHDVLPLPPSPNLEDGFPQSLPEAPQPLTENLNPPWVSGRAIASHGQELFIADPDNSTLWVLDAKKGNIRRSLKLEGRPEQVVVDSVGNAFISVRGIGEIVKVETGSQEVGHRAVIGVDPRGIALSHDESRLYAVASASDSLVTLSADDLELIQHTEGFERPLAVALNHQGFVAVSQANGQIATLLLDEDQVPIEGTHKTAMMRVSSPYLFLTHSTPGEQVSNRGRSVVPHPQTGEFLVVHEQVRPGNEDSSFQAAFAELIEKNREEEDPEGGEAGESGYGVASGLNGDPMAFLIRPMEMSVTSVVPKTVTVAESDADADEENEIPDTIVSYRSGHTTREPVKDPEGDEPLVWAISQPTDINHHPSWSLAFVSGFGSDRVLVLNTAAPDPMVAPVALIHVGFAPKAVTFSEDGNTLHVLNAHSYSVSHIDIRPLFEMEEATYSAVGDGPMDALGEVEWTAVNPVHLSAERESIFASDPLPPLASKGRRIYTYAGNPKMSHAGQFACNSCHFEGGEDGVVWFVAEGPRQTPALSERLEKTAPFNWGGTKADLEDNMSQTIDRMGGEGLDQDELESLEAFLLHGLKSPRNPNLSEEGLNAQQLRGRDLFNDPVVGCNGCHPAPTFTDGSSHDVGTATELEEELGFAFIGDPVGDAVIRYNTPSLKNLWMTAPYLHDGSAKNLFEVFEFTINNMGKVGGLSEDEIHDLIAYLLTL